LRLWGIPRDGQFGVALEELAAQPFDPARDRIPLHHDDGLPVTAVA
jgi:hypothetical protein